MKKLPFFILILSFLLFSFHQERKAKELPELKSIFEKYHMNGSILIFDNAKKE